MGKGCVVLACLGLAACGGGMPPSGSVAPDELDQIEAIASELREAERELVAEAGGAAQAAADAPVPTPSSPSAEPEEPAGEVSPSTAAEPKTEGSQPGAVKTADERRGGSCETACKALASMRRSADRICELAGSAHERCAWARSRVADASERVQRAGCRCE